MHGGRRLQDSRRIGQKKPPFRGGFRKAVALDESQSFTARQPVDAGRCQQGILVLGRQARQVVGETRPDVSTSELLLGICR